MVANASVAMLKFILDSTVLSLPLIFLAGVEVDPEVAAKTVSN